MRDGSVRPVGDYSVLSQKIHVKIDCHPERRLARTLRQSQSKDLRFRGPIYAANFRDATPGAKKAAPRVGTQYLERPIQAAENSIVP